MIAIAHASRPPAEFKAGDGVNDRAGAKAADVSRMIYPQKLQLKLPLTVVVALIGELPGPGNTKRGVWGNSEVEARFGDERIARNRRLDARALIFCDSRSTIGRRFWIPQD